MKPEKDASLNHPALAVYNRTEDLLLLRLEGQGRWELVVPPGEVSRTLLAAGGYRYELRRGGRVVAKGVLTLKRGHRYHLEPDL